MLKDRVLSAIVLLMVIFAVLFFFNPFFFALSVGGIVSLGVWEWTQFAKIKQAFWRFFIAGLFASFMFVFIYSFAPQLSVGHVFEDFAALFLFASVIWWCVALGLVITYPKSAALWSKSALLQGAFGILTLIPFFFAVLKLRLDHYLQSPYQGIGLLLYVCVLVWAADSGAYFAGRAFGKHKLSPKVSPGKTWEGVLGGVISAGVLATLFIFAFGDSLFSQVSMLPLIVLSVATVAISVLGDLTESLFKREAKIKDSSQLIPGHGGVLDRIDSLTAALPFFSFFYFFVL